MASNVTSPSEGTRSKAASSNEDFYYLRELEAIYARRTGVPDMPARVTEFLFIGGYGDAHNLVNLKKRGITHILNCAAIRESMNNPYTLGSGIVAYDQFQADDRDGYDILQHFEKAQAFIDSCREFGGRVLVHCAVGVNRSGAICIAYLMAGCGLDLLSAFDVMKHRRGTVPSNQYFRLELIKFARARGLLKPRTG